MDFGGSRPSGSDLKASTGSMVGKVLQVHNPDHIGGYQAALPMLAGIETKFGLSLPRFASTIPDVPMGMARKKSP